MSLFVDGVQFLALIYLIIVSVLNVRDIRRIDRMPATIVKEYRSLPYEEPKAICGCEHHHCFHDEDGCGHVSQVRNFDTKRFEYYKKARCECKRYTGPEPLPQVLP